MAQLDKETLTNFRNKNYAKAYEGYKEILQTDETKLRYRNINNLLTCIHYLYIEKKDDVLFKEFENYFMEYIKIGKETDNTAWANNILEDLMEYSLELALSKFTENRESFKKQSEKLNGWLKEFIIPFIDSLEIPVKRDKKIFYDAILQKIFKERANFERIGNEYQNVINTKILCNFYLSCIKDKGIYARSRSNIYRLLSELVYSDPTEKNQDYYFLTKKAVKYLDKSLEAYPQNKFSKSQKHQVVNSLIIQEQLHRFDHDVSSKMSTLLSLIRKLKRKNFDLNEPLRMEKIINDMQAILNLSKNESPNPEEVNLEELLKDVQKESVLSLEYIVSGNPEIWISNYGYLKIILENLLKNSREAYDRNKITVPDPAVKIYLDYENNEIKIQDWAGGISEDLLRNDKLFEPYVSQKGVAQGTGLGLASVKKACKKLELSISIESENNSTIIALKKK